MTEPQAYPSVAATEEAPRVQEDIGYDRPMPRLGKGVLWSDIVAEIERDNRARLRYTE